MKLLQLNYEVRWLKRKQRSANKKEVANKEIWDEC